MKLYIDEVTIWELCDILITLPKSLLDLVKEELFWWLVLYKYEISGPVDWQKEQAEGLKESFRRMRRARIRKEGHENICE